MNKLISIIFLLTIIGCGGGSSKAPVIEQGPDAKKAILYSYTVTNDNDTRSYTGKGVSVNGVIYMAPTLISSSDFTVVGDITDGEVRLFSYINRGLVVSFVDGDNSGYHLELNEIGFIDKVSINNIPQEWFNFGYSGSFGDIVTTLTNNDGDLIGSDTAGCNINGEIFDLDGVIGIELNILDCDYSGSYYGALRVGENSIIGSVTNDNNGIMINYTF